MVQFTEAEVRQADWLASWVPFMFGLMFVEWGVALLKGKPFFRVNDTINSVSHGLLEQLIFSLTSKTAEFGMYLWVYNNFALIDIDWSSVTVWIVTFLGVDLGYYVFHRMAHEINVLWASHSVHHSSEEMNLSTAFRQSVFQVYFSWLFYIPMAFFIPPPMFYTHKQFNTMYQFWIHTRTVYKLGPLEYILNTPSHHRVHHARNRQYLDKNYAGILIIWDRMFGTFQEEIEEPAYGLCPPAKSWNILRGQLDHYIHIFRRFRRQQGIANKLSVLFKGPGWVPGGTRLGDISKVPNIDWSKPKYGPEVPTYLNCYVAFHFAITVLISFFLLTNRFYSYILHICVTLFMVLSLQAFSAIYDQREYAYALEFTRLIVFLVSELVCWAIYKDDFLFLWYRDPTWSLIPGIHQPIRILRTIFVLSACWLIGRVSYFGFSSDGTSTPRITKRPRPKPKVDAKLSSAQMPQEESSPHTEPKKSDPKAPLLVE